MLESVSSDSVSFLPFLFFSFFFCFPILSFDASIFDFNRVRDDTGPVLIRRCLALLLVRVDTASVSRRSLSSLALEGGEDVACC